MATDIEETAAALHGTALDGHRVEEGIGDTLILENIDPDHVLAAWRAARSVLPVTGRWPVFTGPGDLHWEPTDADVAQLAAAADAIDPWSVYRRYRGDSELDDWHVQDYVRAFLGHEVRELAAAELSAPMTQHELDRWTYERILADPALATAMQHKYASMATTERWHSMDAVQLVLLPTPKQWLAPAWIVYFGAARDQGYEAWAAAMMQWEQRWGAELVAAWGTMLQYVVTRRPAPGAEAWELAGQLLAVGGSLQMEQWQLASALTCGDAWFLHDRP